MTRRILFSEESVDAIPFAEKGERITYRDTKDRYLHLNVSHTTKTFLVIKKAMGRAFFVTLGNYCAVILAVRCASVKFCPAG